MEYKADTEGSISSLSGFSCKARWFWICNWSESLSTLLLCDHVGTAFEARKKTNITSGFACISQKDDFQIKRFIDSVMAIGPIFKPHKLFFLKMVGRKPIQKRYVTNVHPKHSSISHCTFLHCISCAWKRYQKQIYWIYSRNMYILKKYE